MAKFNKRQERNKRDKLQQSYRVMMLSNATRNMLQWTCLKTRPHQQQCRSNSNIVKATFDFVEATFDFVATNGNNVERVS